MKNFSCFFIFLFACVISFAQKPKKCMLDMTTYGITFNPIANLSYAPDTSFIRTHKIKTISYTEKGTDIKDLKKIYKLHYHKSGKPVKAEYIQGNGDRVQTMRFYLDEKSRIKSYTILKAVPDSLVYTYDKNNLLVKEQMMNMPKITATYSWKNGKLLSKKYDYPSGKTALYEWEYNAKGNVIALFESHDGSNRQKMTDYSYDSKGLNNMTFSGGAVCISKYNSSGWLESTKITYPESYGDKIEESFYNWNQDGTLSSFKLTRKFEVKDKKNTQLQGALNNDNKVLEYSFSYQY